MENPNLTPVLLSDLRPGVKLYARGASHVGAVVVAGRPGDIRFDIFQPDGEFSHRACYKDTEGMVWSLQPHDPEKFADTPEPTITIGQVNKILRNEELGGCPPLSRFVAIVSILKAITAGGRSSDVALAAAARKFNELYGEMTTKTVDEFVGNDPGLLNHSLPMSFVDAILESHK